MQFRREYVSYFSVTLLCIVVLVVTRFVCDDATDYDVVLSENARPLAKEPSFKGDTVTVDEVRVFNSLPFEGKRKNRSYRISLFYSDLDSLLALGVCPDVCDSLARYRKLYVLKGSVDVDSLKMASPSTIASLVKPHLAGMKKVYETSPANGVWVDKVKPRETVSVELNGASADELCRIYQVGPAVSKSIVELRDRLGGFVDVAQIKDVWQIKKYGTYDTISSQVYVDTTLVKPLEINRLSLSDMSRHPYITPVMTSRLAKLRQNDNDYRIADIAHFRQLFGDLKYNILLEKYLIFAEDVQ